MAQLSSTNVSGNLTVSGTVESKGKTVITATSGIAFPSFPSFADECYRTDLDEWYKYNGSVWTQF